MPSRTQVIGDANNRPTLVGAPSFVGLGVLSTDEYTGAPGVGIDGGDPESMSIPPTSTGRFEISS
jgi:hypothetical protein